MNDRGNYQRFRAVVGAPPSPSNPWGLAPGEQTALMLTGHSPTTDSIGRFLAVGAIIAGICVIGTAGMVADIVAPRQKAPPATTSQKVVRVGLLGGLVGGGAYVYFAGKR